MKTTSSMKRKLLVHVNCKIFQFTYLVTNHKQPQKLSKEMHKEIEPYNVYGPASMSNRCMNEINDQNEVICVV